MNFPPSPSRLLKIQLLYDFSSSDATFSCIPTFTFILSICFIITARVIFQNHNLSLSLHYKNIKLISVLLRDTQKIWHTRFCIIWWLINKICLLTMDYYNAAVFLNIKLHTYIPVWLLLISHLRLWRQSVCHSDTNCFHWHLGWMKK